MVECGGNVEILAELLTSIFQDNYFCRNSTSVQCRSTVLHPANDVSHVRV